DFCEPNFTMKKLVPAALRGDWKGMLIAALCLIHCVAGPVLLSFAGFASLIGVSEKLEPLFFSAIDCNRNRHSCSGVSPPARTILVSRAILLWHPVPRCASPSAMVGSARNRSGRNWIWSNSRSARAEPQVLPAMRLL